MTSSRRTELPFRKSYASGNLYCLVNITAVLWEVRKHGALPLKLGEMWWSLAQTRKRQLCLTRPAGFRRKREGWRNSWEFAKRDLQLKWSLCCNNWVFFFFLGHFALYSVESVENVNLVVSIWVTQMSLTASLYKNKNHISVRFCQGPKILNWAKDQESTKVTGVGGRCAVGQA